MPLWVQITLPVATLVVGQMLGYLFGVMQTRSRLFAEKRAEYVSRFIGEAYDKLRFLAIPGAAKDGVPAMAPFALLGNQAGFFVSDAAAEAIDTLTSEFAGYMLKLNAGTRVDQPDCFGEYRTQLAQLRRLLRKELGIRS